MRAGNPWTLERIATLEKLWGEGVTACAIADRLRGVSRSAVLGKIFRLRSGAAAPAPAAPPIDAAERDVGEESADAVSPARRKRSPRRDDSPGCPGTPHLRRKTLFELTNESCRFPYGTPGSSRFGFCGAPGANLELGMPYCAAHAQRAYRTPAHDGKPRRPAAACELHPIASPARKRRYVWRASVRHPAARWR
jgi:GcrA cell cycle regulator